jgi:fumarylacetoacetase
MTAARAASWLPVAEDHLFGLGALPYGSFSQPGHSARRVGVAIGDWVLDLTAASQRLMAGRAADFASGSLDRFLAAGDAAWAQVRRALVRWLGDAEFRPAIEDLLVPVAEVTLHLPFSVADYVDFYASEHHATNVGRIMRPEGDPLTPNWRHLPIGYHGRSGTVVVSGTAVHRPCGQSRPAGSAAPVFGPSRRLDFEAEVGYVVGMPSALGVPVPASRFAEHVFGVCLINDWSARDIQGWEYVPLGPFGGKSFATSISPWIVPLEALAPARIRPPSLDTDLVGYLADSGDWGLNIDLEIRLNGHVVSRPPYSAMHWSPAQMLAHLTINGASLRTGDLFASGTVSGPRPDQFGCLIELTRAGREPLVLPDGTSRAWLADGDEVVISASAPGPDRGRIGLGMVSGQVLQALPPC